MQLDIFGELYETFKINKPIRMVELFAGYGSQSLAMKYLNVPFEHHKICEWAVNSIIAYADLHRNELKDYGKDFTIGMTKDEVAQKLYEYGVSLDYNKPATLEELKRRKEDRLRLCYNAIQCSHNLVDISKVQAKDLNIVDTNIYIYIL